MVDEEAKFWSQIEVSQHYESLIVAAAPSAPY